MLSSLNRTIAGGCGAQPASWDGCAEKAAFDGTNTDWTFSDHFYTPIDPNLGVNRFTFLALYRNDNGKAFFDDVGLIVFPPLGCNNHIHGGRIVPEQTVENMNEELEVLTDEDYIMSMGF